MLKGLGQGGWIAQEGSFETSGRKEAGCYYSENVALIQPIVVTQV
jgi:hypothetical protein